MNHGDTVFVRNQLIYVPKSSLPGILRVNSYLYKWIIPLCRIYKDKHMYNLSIFVGSKFKY